MLPIPTSHQQNTKFKQGGTCLQAFLLPTCKAQNKNHPVIHGQGGQDLQTIISMLPTPMSRDYKGGSNKRKLEANNHGNLDQAIHNLLPTPAPGTHNRGMTPHNGVVNALLRGETPKNQVLTVDVVMAEGLKQQCIEKTETMRGIKTGLKLEPSFVEWLMGFPIGWTELPPVETPSCRKLRTKSLKR